MEQFYTIQGEGVHAGKAAYFIRLAGCDVGCVWCDVKESWDKNKHQVVAVNELVNSALQHPSKLVVITGGEPLMYDLTELTKALHIAQLTVHLETSGAYPLSGNFNWITLSPKKFKPALPEIFPLAHELKVVIYHPSDLAWAESFTEQVSADCVLLLQPEWSKQKTVHPLIVEFVQNNPRWRISLQTHKFLDIP